MDGACWVLTWMLLGQVNTGRWRMTPHPPWPSLQMMSLWAPTPWTLLSTITAAEKSSFLWDMPPPSSPSPVSSGFFREKGEDTNWSFQEWSQLFHQLPYQSKTILHIPRRSNTLRSLAGPGQWHCGWRHALHPEQSDRLHHHPPWPQRVPEWCRHHLQLGIWGWKRSSYIQGADCHPHLHQHWLLQAQGGGPGSDPR